MILKIDLNSHIDLADMLNNDQSRVLNNYLFVYIGYKTNFFCNCENASGLYYIVAMSYA